MRSLYLRFRLFYMFNKYITAHKPSLQFVVFCALLSLSFLLSSYVMSVLSKVLIGITIKEMGDLKTIPAHLSNPLKLFNSIFLFSTLFIPAFLFAYLAYPKPSIYLGLVAPLRKHHLLWGISIILLAIPFSSLLEEWSRFIPAIGNSKALDEEYNKLAASMTAGTAPIDLLWNVLAMCLVPAVVEELFFRGCLQQLLLNWMRKTPLIPIILVAIIFSAFHGQLSGFFPRLFLGLLLGLVYHYSGSIWICIAMHFFNNFLTIILIYLYNTKIIHTDINKLPDMNIVLGVASGAAVMFMLWLFYHDRKPFEIIEVEKEEGLI